jgi:monoamine oxidase
MDSYEILIIGAGAAGLMAANELSKAGKKALVIEAQNRIGGRIYTLIGNNFSSPVELGAEFVHGNYTVTMGLIKAAGIKYSEVKGKMVSVNDRQGGFFEGWGLVEEKLKEVKEDISIADFLDTYFKDEKYAGLKNSIKGFAEGYDTADISEASVIAFRDEWLSEEDATQYRIEGGYGKLMDYLLAESKVKGCVVQLSSVVKEVRWEQGKAKITIENSKKFIANKVVITVPPGILKSGKKSRAHINFIPAILPQIKAVDKLGYGCVIKILFELDEALWNNKEIQKRIGINFDKAGFIFSDEPIPTWWTQYPKESNVLTGWMGGHKAELLKSANEKTIYDKAIQSLANIFKMNEKDLEKKIRAHKIINWTAEPFALGSYSYVTINSTDARKLLNKPIQNTLYFAGEALYDGPEMGTVEAALASGLKAATSILNSNSI